MFPVVYPASMTSIRLGLLLLVAPASFQPEAALDLLDEAGFLWGLPLTLVTSKRSVSPAWPLPPLACLSQPWDEPEYFHFAGAVCELCCADAEGFVW